MPLYKYILFCYKKKLPAKMALPNIPSSRKQVLDFGSLHFHLNIMKQ